MIFSSITFLFYFLPIFMCLYFFLPKQAKNIFLVLASLFFYAWGEPKYVILMIFSTLVDFSFGLLIGKAFNTNKKRYATYALIGSVVTNLSLLFFFKYFDLFLTTANSLFHQNFTLLELTLPIGISFYTFQTMSYTIDVYRQKVEPQRNLIHFATYVTLFPQLIAGPIVRYESINEELVDRTPDMQLGITRFIIGLSQKVLLANNAGLIWEEVLSNLASPLSATTAWLGITAYAFQIYFDFCGYSNMAIGLGNMLGFHFPENFNKPYTSKSITEFWRRWHISLGTWFREYVYIPMGGNRHGTIRLIRNILIVWLLTGFWHGASWNFLFWGLYFGILLLIEKFWLLPKMNKVPKFFLHLYTMFFVLCSWVFFAFNQVSSISAYFRAMFMGNDFTDTLFTYLLSNNLILFIIAILCSSQFATHFLRKFEGKWVEVIKNSFLIIVFLMSIAYIVDSSYNPFLYFRF